MKLMVSLCLLATFGACETAGLRQITDIYQAILHSGDDSLIPKRGGVLDSQEMEDGIKALTPEEVKTLLPLARQCLQSGRLKVRVAGLSLLVSISFRFDSTKLLEPYIDDLGGLLRDSEREIRAPALYILGSTWPSASPKALAYLTVHMSAKDTSVDDVMIAAAGLLNQPGPLDAELVHNVLNVVAAKRDPSLTHAILSQLAHRRVDNEEMQGFVRTSLVDSSPVVRHAAVAALGEMSKEVRGKFISDLQRIARSPAESAEIRSLAEKLLAR